MKVKDFRIWKFIYRYKYIFVFDLASYNPHLQLLCERRNVKVCLSDNLNLLDSSYFKYHGIWVLVKDQRVT